jgi:hypothetical protein
MSDDRDQPPYSRSSDRTLNEMVRDLHEAVLGSMRPGSAPGLLRRQDASEEASRDHEIRITDLETDGKAKQAKLLDRGATMLLNLIQQLIAALLGGFIVLRGFHP